MCCQTLRSQCKLHTQNDSFACGTHPMLIPTAEKTENAHILLDPINIL